MPRVAKPKATAAVAAPVKKALGAKNKSKLYNKPEPIPLNTVLVDLSKNQWKIGPSIGTGGFGEIYSACKAGEKNYDYVVKCEPHGNGPLFVEMHFYMRNAKLEDIQKFKKEHGLKSLGMPYMLGNGSHDLNGQKHRFIVMPRYGRDIAHFFLSNDRRLPEITIYRLALQMLDVYKFIHCCGYVHADLKGANILLGYGKAGASQAYLVDYGLASHYTKKDFKPDPKKMHNGTIEYTSRDAHQGVATMRADLEILGYNLIEWSGAKLPWVRDNLLSTPVKVQQAKMAFMGDVDANMKKLYPVKLPVPIAEFMKYVSSMNYNDTPDYELCKKIFLTALKSLKSTNTGDLDFKLKSSTSYNGVTEATAVVKKNKAKTLKPKNVREEVLSESDSDVEEICASADDDDDVIFERKKSKNTVNKKAIRTAIKVDSPSKRYQIKKTPTPPHKRPGIHEKFPQKLYNSKSPSPTKRKNISKSSFTPSNQKDNAVNSNSPSKNSPTNDSSIPMKSKQVKDNKASSSAALDSRPILRGSPLSSIRNLNLSPSISAASSSAKPGKTIINDNLTPNAKAVNVKRKKKSQDLLNTSRTPTHSTNGRQKYTEDKDCEESPATRVKVRKLQSNSASNSPMHSPAVTLKKTKKFVRSPC